MINQLTSRPIDKLEELIFFFYITTAILFYGFREFTWVPQLIGFVLAGIFTINLIISRRAIGAKSISLVFILTFTTFILHYLHVDNFAGIFLRSYLQVFVLTIICVNVGYFMKSFLPLAWGLIIGCLTLIYTRVLSSGVYIDLAFATRVGGQAGNPNDYSFFLLLGILFSLIILSLKKYNTLIKVILLVSFIILSIELIVIGGSRSSVFAYFLCVLIFTMKYVKRTGILTKILFLVMLIIGSIKFAQIAPDLDVYQRFLSATKTINSGSGYDKSTKHRTVLIKEGFRLWFERPITGHGTNEFRHINTKIRGYYAHNNYVELLCNNGIIGFLLFYIPHILILYIIYFRLPRRSTLRWLTLVMIAILISDLTNITYYNKIYLSVVAFLAGHLISKAEGNEPASLIT